MPPAKSPKPSKKRSRAAAPVAAALVGNDGSSYEPLDPADAPPGWEQLAESLQLLQQCALPTDEQLAALPTPQANAAVGRSAQLGAVVVRVLQQSLELHRSVSALTEPPSRRRAESVPISAAELMGEASTSSIGAPLDALRLPLYDRLAPSQQSGCLSFVRAMASADRDDAGAIVAERDQSSGGSGAGGADEAGDSEAAAEGKAFRDLYMQILAEGVGEELDAVRREGGGRGGKGGAADEEGLAFLVDALEVGASTFSVAERQLALSSYGGHTNELGLSAKK